MLYLIQTLELTLEEITTCHKLYNASLESGGLFSGQSTILN